MLEAIVQKRVSFSAVPDSLFSADLSPAAFKVLAWAFGKPNGWQFRIGHMSRVLGLTDKTWPRVRKELVQAGYFTQSKRRGEGGKFVWMNTFTDSPLWDASIPPKGEDGIQSTIPPKRRDAERRNALQQNLAEEVSSKGFHHSEKAAAAPTLQSPPPPPSAAAVAATPKSFCPPRGQSCVRIENEADQILIDQLRKKYGEEKIESVAVAILVESLTGSRVQPWPGNIQKRLQAEAASVKQSERSAHEAQKATEQQAASELIKSRIAMARSIFSSLPELKQEQLRAAFQSTAVSKFSEPGKPIWEKSFDKFLSDELSPSTNCPLRTE